MTKKPDIRKIVVKAIVIETVDVSGLTEQELDERLVLMRDVVRDILKDEASEDALVTVTVEADRSEGS